jgi:hypothetical protein
MPAGNMRGSLVIAEAPVLDKLITRFFTDTDDTGTKELLYSVFLRGAVSALGQRRFDTERHYFIKFAATSILQFARIRRIWPRVPALFLYRDPIEVMVSTLQNIPEWMTIESNPKASAAVLGVKETDLASPEELCARALGRFYSATASLVDENILLCNYDELSPETLLRLVSFFRVSASHKEAEAIMQTARLYSKDPSQAFRDDGDWKRAGQIHKRTNKMHSSTPVPLKDVVFTDFEGGEGILVNLNTKQYYKLNETGSLIWRGLENGSTVEDIVSEMQTLYEVTREHALTSVDKLLLTLESNQLVKRD